MLILMICRFTIQCQFYHGSTYLILELHPVFTQSNINRNSETNTISNTTTNIDTNTVWEGPLGGAFVLEQHPVSYKYNYKYKYNHK